MKITNYEAEATLLGAILVEGTLFNDLELEEEHFYDARHRRIFRAMKEVFEKKQPIDIVTVTTALLDDIHQIGGTLYLTEMAESVATLANFKQHEALILEAYRMRKSRDLVKGYVENPSDEAMDVLLKKLTHFQDLGTSQKERSTYDYLMEISKDMTEKTIQTGYMTSLSDFDDMTGGLQKGDLIIVAARPSVGKTAFALNLAAGHCKNKGSSLVISLEMGTKQLLERMISAEGMMDGRKWRNLLFSEEDYEKAFRAIGTIASWDLTIFDTKRTLSQVRSTIRNAVQKDPNGHHLVIIDYLQLITPTTIRKDRRDLEIGEITRELKLLAMELKVPIVLLSQLSRGVESRQDKRPLMSDLRESGNIEQDADVITFLYRDDYYNRMSESPTITEIIISKHRNGPTGTVEVEFWKEYGRFGDMRDVQGTHENIESRRENGFSMEF